MSFKLQGSAELKANLAKLKETQAVNLIRASGVEALQPIADAARANAPRRTGYLRASIGVGWRLTRRQSRITSKESQVEIYVGAGNVPGYVQGGAAHAHLVEFGTQHQEPQPFLRPAWEAMLPQVLPALARSAWRRIAAKFPTR